VNIRTMVESDLDNILALLANQSINTVTIERFAEYLESGAYRHEWTWVAEDGDRILALAVWWGTEGSDHPFAVDGLYFDQSAANEGPGPVPLWTELIRAMISTIPPAAEQPEYHIFLPNGWRDQPEVVAALEPRLAAAAAAGLSATTERLRYEWTTEDELPPRSTRLRFEPADDEAFLAVFRQVMEGSLDAASARAVARIGVEGAAKEELEIYTSMPGDRDWWRLAYDASGELVGFAIPSANNGGPVVGYLGVLPEHRGHGHSDDLLAEITHVLAELIQRDELRANGIRANGIRANGIGADRIRADTDLTNKPMAAAFERAGYRNFAVRMVASYPLS
jgi:GNAT superfamily N-acetyltransferase